MLTVQYKMDLRKKAKVEMKFVNYKEIQQVFILNLYLHKCILFICTITKLKSKVESNEAIWTPPLVFYLCGLAGKIFKMHKN